MPEKNLHITPELLKAYVNGTLSMTERHAVEKAALRDATVRDALAGYEQLNEQKTDLTAVNNRLKSRLRERIHKTEKKRVFVWWRYGLAASVIFGLMIGSYFVLNELPTENLTYEASPVETETDVKPTQQDNEQAIKSNESIGNTPASSSVVQPQAQRNNAAKIPDKEIALDAVVVTANRPAFKREAKISETAPISATPSLSKKMEIAGTVTDAEGEPLPGVSVTVKDKTEQTKTNAKGEFKLQNVSPADAIQLSYSGFAQKEIKAKDVEELIVLSEDTARLSEIVVTGYGKQNQAASPTMGWQEFRKKLEIGGQEKGKITILLTISTSGEVVKKELKKGLGEPYDSQALNLSVFTSPWNPTYKNGAAVEETMRVVVRVR